MGTIKQAYETIVGCSPNIRYDRTGACPHDYFDVDLIDCWSSTCRECWNREYLGEEFFGRLDTCTTEEITGMCDCNIKDLF